MAEAEQAPDKLQVAIVGDAGYVRVIARGSYRISSAMKEFGIAAIEQGVSRIILDMAECVGMDSTFMGVIAGVAFRLKKKSGGEVVMVNLSPRTRGLLGTLGLDQLVKPFMAGAIPKDIEAILDGCKRLEDVQNGERTRLETAEMMLEAHENLIELTPENLPRFKDVLTFLREDVQKQEG